MTRIIFLPAALGLALAACTTAQPVTTTTATGKTVVSAAAVGAHLVEAGQVAQLAVALAPAASVQLPASASADLVKAATALIASGHAMEQSGATSGDAAANLSLAYASLTALEAGYASAGPAQAAQVAKVQGYVQAFSVAVQLYDEQAPALGLAVVTLPAGA